MDRAELDRQYSPSSRAPDFARILDRYRTESAAARAHLANELDVPYGPGPAERLDFFPAAPDRTDRPRRAPLHVFVHGGHWQELSKDDSCFAAPALVAAGAGFVALGYGLAPEHRLETMVDSVRRGLCWLREHARELGTGPDLLFASGSSAGAHLVAMALATTPTGEPAPAGEPGTVAGACLLSGVYDLEPVRHSYVNEAVGLTRATAFANSPLHHLPLHTADVIVARGAAETDEYARQHATFARALQAPGGGTHRDLVVAGRNHFDLPLDLGRRGTVLGDAVLRQMRLDA
jgi:arylformamidase